jgi:hypothetical protein
MSDPTFSVVMAVQHVNDTVAKCLGSLARHDSQQEVEIIVADGSSEGIADSIAKRYATVKILRFLTPQSTPELLKHALREARGSIVAVTSPYSLFAPDWVDRVRRAHDSGFPVVGGAVEHGGPDNLVGWACYFSDYGAFMLPAPRGVTHLLAGNHVSYNRAMIQKSLDSMQDGYWKVFFHSELERQGIRFLFDPGLVISCVQCESFWGFTRRYYRDARQFADLRCRRVSFVTRFLLVAIAPVLPVLLLFRRFKAVWGKRMNRVKFLLSLPLIAAFVISWSAGELAGYLSGPKAGLGKSY